MADILDGLIPAAPGSDAAKAEATVRDVRERSHALVANLVDRLNQGFDAVWSNPHGLTPEQVVAALDTAAASVFRRHGAFLGLFAAQYPQALPMLRMPPAGWGIAYEVDAGVETGRVILTRPASVNDLITTE